MMSEVERDVQFRKMRLRQKAMGEALFEHFMPVLQRPGGSRDPLIEPLTFLCAKTREPSRPAPKVNRQRPQLLPALRQESSTRQLRRDNSLSFRRLPALARREPECRR